MVCVVWLPQYIVLHLYLEILTLLTVQIQVLCALLTTTTILLQFHLISLSLSFGAKLLIQLQKHYDTYV